jgi:mono/diheme cytochrome c family protein
MKSVRAVIASALALAVSPVFAGSEKPGALTQEEKVARGRYLVTIVGCNDCHTPHLAGPQGPEMDPKLLLSGHPETRRQNTASSWAFCSDDTSTAWIGPWGTSFARNLTQDKETGIGRWSEKDFFDTLRTGRRMGTGRHLLEPMPWRWFAQMRDDDIRSIFAYLKTVKPIKNRVPDAVPPMVPQDAAADSATAAADGGAEPPAGGRVMTPAEMVARGKYLVTIVGCNDCHTPHVVGSEGPQMDSTLMLSGHPEDRDPNKPLMWTVCSAASYTAMTGPWGTTFTRNLTPDKQTGIGSWTEQNFVDTMRTGRRMGKGRQLQEPMPWRWFAEMTDEDLQSIYAYLMTVKPIKNHVPEPRPLAGPAAPASKAR